MPQELGLNWEGNFSLLSLIISLSLGAILALLLSWHFRRFGSTLANREEFSHVFPFISLTTVLIIFVVKSSLALSLGLVGALSIVRFRTPVKEPEELAYLFMAIAMGLGLGANRLAATVVASLIILTIIALLKWKRQTVENKNLYLSIDWQENDAKNPDTSLEMLNEVLLKYFKESDLRRFDARKKSLEATYLVRIEDVRDLSRLTSELQRTFPSAGVTFIDQNQIPSV